MLVWNRRLFGGNPLSQLRQAACLILLAAVGQSIALPIIDHHAAEYSPWHAHFVLGAGDTREAAWALAHHSHSFEHPHAHGSGFGQSHWPTPATSDHRPTPQVLVAGRDPIQLLSASLAVDIGLARPAGLGPPFVRLWRPLPHPDFFAVWNAVAPPAPPPRAA